MQTPYIIGLYREKDWRHFFRKLRSTVGLTASMFMARTFGQYIHSGWDGRIEYTRYLWRGQEWVIPSGPIKKEI